LGAVCELTVAIFILQHLQEAKELVNPTHPLTPHGIEKHPAGRGKAFHHHGPRLEGQGGLGKEGLGGKSQGKKDARTQEQGFFPVCAHELPRPFWGLGPLF
jgi:hypothetical protein